MADERERDIVAEALDQCVVDFERGLNAHGSPTYSVAQEVVERLRKKLTPKFHENLVEQKRTWHGPRGDGRRLTRMAFYLGAIAAFHADGDAMACVTQKHVEDAFGYVREHCNEVEITGIYCD